MIKIKIQLGSTSSQKIPKAEDITTQELYDIFKKETDKNALVKRHGEWFETKIFIKWQDNYLALQHDEVMELHDEVIEEKVDIEEAIEDVVNGKKELTAHYTDESVCENCNKRRLIAPETGMCQVCDGEMSEIEYLRERNKDCTDTNKQIAQRLMTSKDLSEDELRILLKEQQEINKFKQKDALLYLADMFEVNLLSEEDYLKPREMNKAIKYFHKIEFLYEFMNTKMVLKKDKKTGKIYKPNKKEITEITEIAKMVGKL